MVVRMEISMSENKVGREQKIRRTAEKVLLEIWKKRTESIREDYEKNHERYDREIMTGIDTLLTRWETVCREQPENLKYVIISPLKSGVVTRSYDYQFALFGQELFVDENPLCFYWSPEFIYRDVDADMTAFHRQASKEIIRLRKDEIDDIRCRYVLCHEYASLQYLDKIIKRMNEFPVWAKLVTEDVSVLYGVYMEQMLEISKTEKGDSA